MAKKPTPTAVEAESVVTETSSASLHDTGIIDADQAPPRVVVASTARSYDELLRENRMYKIITAVLSGIILLIGIVMVVSAIVRHDRYDDRRTMMQQGTQQRPMMRGSY